MSYRIVIEAANLAFATRVVSRLGHVDEEALLTTIGAIGESQTRRRIEEEKTAPDGSAWAPNEEGTSILLKTGMHLRDSIAFNVGAGEVEWGSSWEFAHVHQGGATIVPKEAAFLAFTSGGKFRLAKKVVIPARPFVGISADNAQELEAVVTDFLGSML